MKIYFKAYIRLYGITLTDLITYSLHPSLLPVGANSNGTPSRWWRPAVSPSARSHCCSRAAGEIIHWGFSYQRTWLLILPWDNGHRCWLKGSCRLQRLSSARWWAWETLSIVTKMRECEDWRTLCYSLYLGCRLARPPGGRDEQPVVNWRKAFLSAPVIPTWQIKHLHFILFNHDDIHLQI